MSAESHLPGRRKLTRRRKVGKAVLVWGIWLSGAAVCAAGLRYTRVDNSLANWMPDRQALGTVASYVVIGFSASDFGAGNIADDLRGLSSVAVCIGPSTVETLGRLANLTPENFVVGADGSYVGIFCFRREKADDQEFVAEIRQVLRRRAGENMARFALGGPAIFRVQLDEFSQKRLPAIMLAIVGIGGLMLWWITGRATAAAAAMAGVVLSQIVLTGMIARLGIPMDMALSMVPPLMMALGFSYAAHRALRKGVSGALALSFLTTAMGIGSFALADVPPIRRFALFGVVGLALVWLAAQTLVPSPKHDRRPHRPFSRWLRPLLACCLLATQRCPRTVLVLAAVATCTSAATAFFLRFETNPLNYFPPDSRIVKDFSSLDARLTGMLPFQVTISGAADPTAMLSETPGVRKVVNISRWVNADSQTYWCLADNDALPSLAGHQASWKAWADEHGVTLKWRGVAGQLYEVGVIVRRVAVVSLPVMLITAALVVGLLTRSVFAAAASVWVNVLPVAGLALIAGATRWPLGLPAMMIGAIAIGLAIDDTVHLVVAFRKAHLPVRAVVRCWRPCVGSSIVTAACMLLFVLCPFRPTAQFGILMALAVMIALASDLLVLPIFLANKRFCRHVQQRGQPSR